MSVSWVLHKHIITRDVHTHECIDVIQNFDLLRHRRRDSEIG